ncbi:hypothetical protein UFOVP1623_25 [uncultured Caudovirales phage]|uniref:Uncharacterized protein n=1 Tax=uncultured Caudovirales phage TaxID=2100421 RepID=A0A6J5SYY4_9CAUD|nr:hypothetical protein UFOVP1376_38 [uncultured Caudovirales phage]CAB4220723.1 hypothetical protein UFOVP1623_25 [uncultured Caudovirales phage]
MLTIKGRITYPPREPAAEPQPETPHRGAVAGGDRKAFDAAICAGTPTAKLMMVFRVSNEAIQGRKRRLRKMGKVA